MENIVTPVSPERSRSGRLGRIHGQRFELSVREDLNEKGWLVFKNDNQVYLDENEFKQAKRSFNPFTKMVGYGNGFPDFVCIDIKEFDIKFVESKKNKYLSQEEKLKVAWIKENLKIPVEVAFNNKDGEIEYVSVG